MACVCVSLLLWIVLATGLLNISPVQSSYQPLYVYIDAVSGEDSRECLNSNSTVKACQSLPFVANNLTRTNFVNIEIVSEWLNLTKQIEFRSYTHLNISGSGSTTLHCNEYNAGLAFVRVKNLTIHSITIDQCGALRESTSVDPQKPHETERLSVAVYLLNCTDVTIWRVDIQSSNGTGLSMYDTNGKINIEFSNFTNNSGVQSDVGGGGLHIEFTLCSPGIVGICSGHNGSNQHSTITIQNCSFSYNVAISPIERDMPIVPSTSSAIPRTGKGGGLYISIGLNAKHNSITIAACNFTKNNASFVAGGMLVEFLNSVQNNKISVTKTNFLGNTCFERHACTGGGIVLGFLFYVQSYVHGTLPADNSFSCSYCVFEYNQGYMGGGMGIIANKGVNSSNKRSNITFSNCSWKNNASPVGAAVYVSPGVWDFGTEGFWPIPLFSNCFFESNSAFQVFNSFENGVNISSLGNGAFFISELRVRFEGRTTFRNNIGSAVYLSASILEFSEGSMVLFDNNAGHNGGAISMHASSVIHLNNDSIFYFTNNRAYATGGAISTSVIAALQSTYRNCFIQSVSREYLTNSTVHFKGNHANIGGHSIFASSLKPCKSLCPERTYVENPEAILQCIANFSFFNNTSSIATRPNSFTLHETVPVKVMPGTEYGLNLTVSDEANNSLSGIVYESIIESNENVHMDPAFLEVSNNTINILGNKSDTAVLYLDTPDISLSFSITLVDCKPGYIPQNNRCECATSDYLGLVTCNPNIQQGYWMGFCSRNSTKLCTTFCPYGFCSYHGMNPNTSLHPLPSNSNLLDPQMCGPYRTGRVCSQCAENHSVYFHSWKYSCGPEDLCYLGWFFYLVSEILPVTLFFVIILVFNISFTNGNVNCFVFYAQILDALATNANGAIVFPRFTVVLRTILTFFYRPFNFDFFYLEQLSFCLWKGATVMDVLLMKYATVGFALVLVVLTILVAKYRCGQFKIFVKFHTSSSVIIHGLSAFFVLCYSLSVRVTFEILNYVCLYSTNFKCEVKVVNRIGYMNYLEGDHVKYAIIAIFVLIFMIIIPPLLLILYPLVFKLLGLCKLSESKLAGILWRVMPIQLLDSFQSSFKDNFRFFAGLYFFYRAIILAAYAYCWGLLQFYSIIQLQLILVLTVHAIFQPYKERNHNIIDTLLFTNLAIINAITLYNFAAKDFVGQQTAHILVNIMSFIQAVLIFLPFLFVIILGITKWRRWRKHVTDMDGLPPLRSVESEPLILSW